MRHIACSSATILIVCCGYVWSFGTQSAQVPKPRKRISSSIGDVKPLPESLRIKLAANDAAGREAREFFNAGKYHEAELRARVGLEYIKSDTWLQGLLAESLMRQGLVEEPLALFKKINEEHKDSMSFSRVGYLLFRKGDIQASSRMWNPDLFVGSPTGFREGIPRPTDPRSLEGAWLFAVGYMTDGHHKDKETLHHYSQALAKLPQNVLLNWRMGKIYLRNKEFAKAAQHFKAAERHATGRMKEYCRRDVGNAMRGIAIQKGLIKG